MGYLRTRSVRAFLLPAAALLALGAFGCGEDSVKLYPVTGKINLNNAPFKVETAVVLFKPNKSRGNQGRLEPVGKVDAEGNYTMHTNGRPGAPLGWYKVVVTAHDGKAPAKRQPDQRPAPSSVLAYTYGSEQTTPLAIQVVESPDEGHYELSLRQ